MFSDEQISERAGGSMGVMAAFLVLRDTLSPAQFEMFWESSPQDPDELWADFGRRLRDSGNSGYGFLEYARAVIKENIFRYLRPRSCLLSRLDPVVADGIVGITLEKMVRSGVQMTETEILAAHREEQPALGKLQQYLCRGCNMRECPVYPGSRSQERGWESGGLASLRDGHLRERERRGEVYLLRILPREVRDRLKAAGVETRAFINHSRRAPSLSITFQKGDECVHVCAHTGRLSGMTVCRSSVLEQRHGTFTEQLLAQVLRAVIDSYLPQG